MTVSSFTTRFSSLHALRANSAAQQNGHFLRELSYSLRITTYHTPVTVIPNALFTAGKKPLYKASVNVGHPQLGGASCLAYRCFYISSAVQEESLLVLLPLTRMHSEVASLFIRLMLFIREKLIKQDSKSSCECYLRIFTA